ncbi:MAG: CHAP domain-containing protein [Clostridia bacterium]|nr:CHAP domain-containing protein [Clostridia bacterium]
MPDIKEVADRTIKTIDSAKIATERIKDTGIKTVNETKSAATSHSKNVNEYGSERIESTTHSAAETVVYEAEQTNKRVKKHIRKKFEQKYYSDRHQPQSTNEGNFETSPSNQTVESEIAPRRPQRAIQREYETPKPQNPVKKIKTVEAGEIKQKTKATYKSADASIKTVERTTKETAKAAQKSKQAFKSAKESKVVAKEAAKKSAQAAKKSAEIAKAAAKKAAQLAKKLADFLVKLFKAIGAAFKELGAAIGAGGGVAVVVIIVLCLIGAIAFSIYGIFYSGEDSGTGITVHSAVAEFNEAFQQKNDEILSSVKYDKLEMSGSQADWKDVLAVYTVKLCGDTDNPTEVATMDESKKKELEKVFWDMNSIDYHTVTKETKKMVEVEENGKKVKKEKIIRTVWLYIEHNSKTANQMAEEYGFTAKQKEDLAELLSPANESLWISLIYGLGLNQTVDVTNLNFQNEKATVEQKKVALVAMNADSYGIPAIKGYCEGWVADVYNVAVHNRGYAYSAIAAGRAWSVSKDWSQIQIGATVYGHAGNPCGHVGIYIGGGMVAHNNGGVIVESLEHWISWYSGVCWGWENGYNLSGNPKYNSVGALI